MVTVGVTYDDGQTWTGNAPPLYFEPRGKQVQLSDAAAQSAREGKNALADDVRAMAALVPRQATLVPAYVVNEQDQRAIQARDGASHRSDEGRAMSSAAEVAAVRAIQQQLGHKGPIVTRSGEVFGATPNQTAASPVALAATSARLCSSMTSRFWDSNVGEDWYATAAPAMRIATGMYFELWVWGTNTVAASGFVGDGFGALEVGCTPTLNLNNGTYAMFLYTMGTVAGNMILVRDELVNNDVWAAWYQVNWPPPGGLVNAPVARTDTAMNVYQAVAFALTQNPGLTPFSSWKVFRVNDTAGAGGTPLTAQGGEGFVWIGRPNSEAKFIITHELGHAVEQNSAGVGAASNLSDVGNPPAPCQSTATNHLLTSREWISTAHTEGFAQFYAAATFNIASPGANCWMNIGGTLVLKQANGWDSGLAF